MMSTHHHEPVHAPKPGEPGLSDRYVHAATRRLPEDQRADVADELRGNIADRIESLRARRPELSAGDAEYAALEELGDPDRMAAHYTGNRLQLIGPELYPGYVRVLRSVLVAAVPVATVVIAVVEALTGSSFGATIGKTLWMALTITVHIAFWVTLAFALVERGSSPGQPQEPAELRWKPQRLPSLPRSPRGSLSDLIASLTFLSLVAAAIVWQQLRSPIRDDGEPLPLLDPELWSFWLPLILVLLVAEALLEVVKYRAGGWSTGLATVNVVLGLVFAAPLIYLAATERLLNPAAVTAIQDDWSGFDPSVAHTVVLVTAVVIWVWDSIDGWRKALTERSSARC
jgi:hypothetical protein